MPSRGDYNSLTFLVFLLAAGGTRLLLTGGFGWVRELFFRHLHVHILCTGDNLSIDYLLDHHPHSLCHHWLSYKVGTHNR